MQMLLEDAIKQALVVRQQVLIWMLIQPGELIRTGIILVALDTKLAKYWLQEGHSRP